MCFLQQQYLYKYCEKSKKMGDEPSKQQQGQKLKQTQTQVLQRASKLVQQLKLFSSQQQLREQRHLFARILIYGHENLLIHLQKFPKERQKEIVRELKIDYQTTDLLYQNLVVKRMKEAKKDTIYDQFLGILDKNKQQRENPAKFKMVEEEGIQILNSKKVAVVLFAGGNSTRFKNHEQKSIPKQLYKQKQDQKSLLEIAIEKLSILKQSYPELHLYLVHNEQNHKGMNTILADYIDKNLQIKKLLQNESQIVNLSGKMCLKNKQSFQLLTMPKGCGDLANLSVKGTRLFDQMSQNGIQYVCAVGVQNISAIIADPYLLGVLATNPALSVAFKCTYPNSEDQNLKRIVYNKTKKRVQATQLQILVQSSSKSHTKSLKQSPVWLNNLAFRLADIKKYLATKRENPKLSQIFRAKKIQCTYWNPQSEKYEEQQHCYMFQRELNDLVLNEQLKCIGVMVERQSQFAPVFTINDEWNWNDAYNQYLYQIKKKGVKEKEKNLQENYFSVVYSTTEKSEI